MALTFYANGSRVLALKSPMMSGTDVKFVQEFIGTSHAGAADGIFGAQTKKGVEWYQGMRGIAVDGIVGPTTWSHMLGKATPAPPPPPPAPRPGGLAGNVFFPGTPLANVGNNPNPGRITHEMWMFWAACKALEPTLLLGGIFANKPGYHNYRDALSASDYSVGQFAADREGPGWAAAAIDLTFPDAQASRYATIAKYSDRLLVSGKDMNDERGNYLREFYGQADGDLQVEGWDFQRLVTVSSDSSHLWHIHISILRKYLQDPKAFRALYSILSGESVVTWRSREAALLAPPPVPAPEPAPEPTPQPDLDADLDVKAKAVLELLRPHAKALDEGLLKLANAVGSLTIALDDLEDVDADLANVTVEDIKEVLKK